MKPLNAYLELFDLPGKLMAIFDTANAPRLSDPLNRLDRAATRVGESFSGSWLGYHARVYYNGFKPPPPGEHFSQEWGLKELYTDMGTTGDWREYSADQVTTHIEHLAGNPDLAETDEIVRMAADTFQAAKAEALSIFEVILTDQPDAFLGGIKEQVEKLGLVTSSDVAEILSPKGQIISRDMVAINQRVQIPPHIAIIARVRSMQHTIGLCKQTANHISKAASHLERKGTRKMAEGRIGTNVFIGHGRSAVWRDLKDFVQDRLKLPWDEFNRVPIAGLTNITRLSEMLDAAAFAFVVMTAEDEQVDGATHARMNVIHEVGLFQGRLGFTKAIVLLEDGCTEFTNIQGLGQIRFPKGDIKSKFEDIRQVLERESVISV